MDGLSLLRELLQLRRSQHKPAVLGRLPSSDAAPQATQSTPTEAFQGLLTAIHADCAISNC